MGLVQLLVINRSSSRTASLRFSRVTTILLMSGPFKHISCVLYDWLGDLSPAPHHRSRSTDAIGRAFDTRWQTLMDQLMSLRDTLSSWWLVVLLSWDIARISLEELSSLATCSKVLLRSTILMRRTRPAVIYDRLLAEADDIFEIVCLGAIWSLSDIVIDH